MSDSVPDDAFLLVSFLRVRHMAGAYETAMELLTAAVEDSLDAVDGTRDESLLVRAVTSVVKDLPGEPSDELIHLLGALARVAATLLLVPEPERVSPGEDIADHLDAQAARRKLRSLGRQAQLARFHDWPPVGR